jgi:hypothetical protein
MGSVEGEENGNFANCHGDGAYETESSDQNKVLLANTANYSIHHRGGDRASEHVG